MIAIRTLSYLFATLMVSAFLVFSWFGYKADSVMDKSGLGDISEFQKYSTFADISFWAMVFFWILAILFAQFSPKAFRKRALFMVGLLIPFVFAVTYVLLLSF